MFGENIDFIYLFWLNSCNRNITSMMFLIELYIYITHYLYGQLGYLNFYKIMQGTKSFKCILPI